MADVGDETGLPWPAAPTGGPAGAGGARTGGASAGGSQRGRTVISPLAVERIAAQAAREALAGRLPATAPEPRAAARLDGLLARMTLTLAVPYPAPVRGVGREVRAHVVDTLRRLADVDAREVDIVVSRAEAAAPAHRRVQ